MPSDTAATWNRLLAGDRGGVMPAADAVASGPDIGTEDDFRLLGGNLTGKRVLELGCGAGQNLVAMARQGAHAIGVDFAGDQDQPPGERPRHHDLADCYLSVAKSSTICMATSSWYCTGGLFMK